MNQADVANLVGALLQFMVGMGMLALVVTLAVLDRRGFRRHWKAGLAIGLIYFALMLPNLVFALTFVDPSQIMPQGPGDPTGSRFMEIGFRIGMALGGLVLIVRIGWYMLEYYVAAAEWRHFKPDPFPILQGRENRRVGTLFGAAIFGLVTGGLSTAALEALGVDVSDSIRMAQRLFPLADQVSPTIRIPILLLAMSGMAIAEELAFRGVLLGWLLRVGHRRGAYAVFAMVVVSLIWALLHIPNTNAPLLKCGQIFLIGLCLCEFARRWSVEAAIAGHVALNAAAVILGLIVYNTPA
ncbi:MAG: CPBP family intramembrane glutamic endopeptidase [Candidatus Brocadiia bacterium]